MARAPQSGVAGVHWIVYRGKWRATVKIDGRLRSLGLYPSVRTAANALRDYHAGKLQPSKVGGYRR